MKIVYVVLHFNAYDMTCQCIESLIKISSYDSQIVIVDNKSTNNSGSDLEKKYECEDRIHIIKSEENLGFAKGNNLGYHYAKTILNADVIIDINNDIIIEQREFEDIIKEYCENQSNIAVLAPAILNRKGFYQNPYRVEKVSSGWILKSLLLHCIYFISLKTGIFREKIYGYYHKNEDNSRARNNHDRQINDIVPHGSCVIFMPSFVKNSDYAFLPLTFFYGEEDILYDFLRVNDMKSLYTNKLLVHHMEKISTQTVSVEKWEKELFQVSNKIRSKWVLLKYRFQNHIL